MKTLLLFVGLLLLMGCSRSSNDATPVTPQPPTTSCTLTAYELTTNVQSQGASGTNKETYGTEFDANGLLTRAVSQYTVQGPTGSISTPTTVDYQYDGAGLLQESVETNQIDTQYSGSQSTTRSTTTTRFGYDNGRLATVVRRYVSGTSRSTTNETYQYDNDGRLSQYMSTDSVSRSVTVYLFSGGALTRVTENGKDRYTIQNGRILSSSTGLTYTYDAQGRLIRLTNAYSSGSSIVEYEYNDAGQSWLWTRPELRFKGIPFAALLQTQPGAELYGLVRRQTQYREVNGTRTKIDESVNTYQLNPKGYPTSQTTTRTVTDGSTVRTEQTTGQYSYRDC